MSVRRLSLEVDASHTKHRTYGTRQTRSRRQLNLIANPEPLVLWFIKARQSRIAAGVQRIVAIKDAPPSNATPPCYTARLISGCRTHSRHLSVVLVFVRAVILAYVRLASGAYARHFFSASLAWLPGSHDFVRCRYIFQNERYRSPCLRTRIWLMNSSGVSIWLAGIHSLESSTSLS